MRENDPDFSPEFDAAEELIKQEKKRIDKEMKKYEEYLEEYFIVFAAS